MFSLTVLELSAKTVAWLCTAQLQDRHCYPVLCISHGLWGTNEEVGKDYFCALLYRTECRVLGMDGIWRSIVFSCFSL